LLTKTRVRIAASLLAIVAQAGIVAVARPALAVAAQVAPAAASDWTGNVGRAEGTVNGTMPRASLAPRTLAAARAAITRLPHSPRLLAELAGHAGTPGQGQPTGAAAGSYLRGLDVAAFQHPDTKRYPKGVPIAWRAVAAAGYGFAAIKGTEGDYYVNPWASRDVAQAKAAGLDVSIYHFAVPNVSGGAEQARFAIERSNYATGPRMLPIMLDIEYDPYVADDHTNECYGLSARKMTAWISAFVTTARTLTGQYPIIYTTAGWWDTCTRRAAGFGHDPVWVAAYGNGSPPLPAGWGAWTFWQYTSDGTVRGIDSSGTTDLDLFNPLFVGLIDPGGQASHPRQRVSLPVGSLGARAGETLAWTASGLPPGLRVSASGVIRGAVAGGRRSPANPYDVTVTAKNTAATIATVAFRWRITTPSASLSRLRHRASRRVVSPGEKGSRPPSGID
jgi:GH25 family lysozyme M1 (1,4-beta-N-acetylmuramidase)